MEAEDLKPTEIEEEKNTAEEIKNVSAEHSLPDGEDPAPKEIEQDEEENGIDTDVGNVDEGIIS